MQTGEAVRLIPSCFRPDGEALLALVCRVGRRPPASLRRELHHYVRVGLDGGPEGDLAAHPDRANKLL